MAKSLITALVLIFCATLSFAQAPTVNFYLNGNPLTSANNQINKDYRVTIMVMDGLPRNGGTAYEFGEIEAYRIVNGQRQHVRRFKASEVFNGPVMNVTFGPQKHPDLTGQIELEIAWIKRYNLNNTVETLPFSSAQRTLSFVVQN